MPTSRKPKPSGSASKSASENSGKKVKPRKPAARKSAASPRIPKRLASKAAEPATIAANQAMLDLLNFGDERDFEDATRGFVAALDPVTIQGPGDGPPVWNMEDYNFIEGNTPATVNPSLWRQAKLNRISGLFTIHPRIHQIRGHDISNMTLIEGDTGWIVIDPLLSVETARASLQFANEKLGERPVRGIIYTHSHADHFGGVRGVVDEGDVRSGRIPVIAPNGFMEFAISENVLAGNAMNRRARYQFGNDLPRSAQAQVCCGLGKAISRGTISLIAPTDIIKETLETRTVDGVEIVFQMANGSEAPAEFMFYFPQFRALCASEVTSHNMHNILTPRGAEVRNALHWSRYIDETIELFAGKTDLLFACHHWPTWGREEVTAFLERQRDVYRFIHDETLRLVNHGCDMHEAAEHLVLPDTLAHDFACRGYYGTLNHNIKAVYQFYLGWWDGNPATYHQLPRVESGKRLIRAMGGVKKVIAEGRRAFKEGDFRWTAELMNHVMFVEPENDTARLLQADTLEQLGYQAESGIWRNIFLTGAMELRHDVRRSASLSTMGPDLLSAMSIEMVLDFLAVKFNPERSTLREFSLQLELTDAEEIYALVVSNGVLNNRKGRKIRKPEVHLKLSKGAFFRLITQMATMTDLVGEGVASVSGEVSQLQELFASLDEFDPHFKVVSR